MEFIAEYVGFLAKTVTLVVAILIVLAILMLYWFPALVTWLPSRM